MIGEIKQPFTIEVELNENSATFKNLIKIFVNKKDNFNSILMHNQLYHDLISCPKTFGYVNHFEGDFHPTIFNLKIIRTNDIDKNSVFMF